MASGLSEHPTNGSRTRDALTLFTLMIAAEAIYFLPFVIARIFRPTMLDIFAITNFELGLAFSAYGVVAMLAYFPGGPLADLFAPKKLMVIALLSTAVGGLVMSTIPGLPKLRVLYAYWGLTTVLLFWAAMIRAVRQLGGKHYSGSAFGLLDGGRGLVAAASASIAVMIYASLLPADVESATMSERSQAFEKMILVFAAATAAASVLVWFVIPNQGPAEDSERPTVTLFGGFTVLKLPAVWLQSIIIVCAYVAYKGLDDVSLYAKVALDFDEVNAAYSGTVSMWVRPFAAVAAGLIADRTRVSRMTAASFLVLAIGSGVIASGILQAGMIVGFFMVIVGTSAAVHALRGLYFAIMQEGEIPLEYTGTVVGIVSTVGYTPDIFMGPLMGKLLDDSPGILGHQHVFAVIAAFSMVGCAAAMVFQRFVKLRH